MIDGDISGLVYPRWDGFELLGGGTIFDGHSAPFDCRSEDVRVHALFYNETEIKSNTRYRALARNRIGSDITMETGLYVIHGGAGINLKYIFQNIGHSPAKNIRIYLESRSQGTRKKSILEYQRDFCEDAARRPQEEPTHILFPGDTLSIPAKASTSPVAGGGLTPEIVGCVTYEFDFSDRIHTTGFVFAIYRGKKTVTSSSMAGIFEPPEGQEATTIDPSELIIERYQNSDIAD